MTVAPAIANTPAEGPSQSSSVKSQNKQSKDFYEYLRARSHDHDSDESQSVQERTSKPRKQEKRTTKATEQDAADQNTTPAPSQPTETPVVPPLSIAALLGLPTVPTTDNAETGKTSSDDGQAVLSQDPINADTANNTILSAAKPAVPADHLISNTKNQKKDNTDSVLNPALLLGSGVPQLLNMAASSSENKQADSAVVAGSTSSSSGKNVEILAAAQSADDQPSSPTPGNLAFALKLNDGEANIKEQHTPVDAANAVADAAVNNSGLAASVQATTDSPSKEQSHQHDGETGTPFYEIPQAPAQKISDSTHPITEQPATTSVTDTQTMPDTSSTEPVRNMHVQLVGDNNSRVDVRLVDRGGELHVSVKSGDANLAQTLQNHMPELTSRLDQQHFQSEVWLPKLDDNTKTELSGRQDFASGGNNSQTGNGDNASERQGKGQQQYRPDWVDVLENSTRGTGKVNPIWQQ